jgi:trimethylamine-N-oxide reductase (cytochrome c)
MGHPVIADSKNGKIIRIRPVHFDEKQDWDSLNPWTIEARGKSFTVPRKSSPAPFCLSYKQSIYGPDRVRYPLKRVDWDPSGDRNTQNRGKSKYKRISWDEAYEILASEVKRIHDEYGPYGILCQMDGHGESKNFAERHGPMSTLCTYMGGYTGLNRNPDSWEGWVWGAKHVWGQETVGKMANHTNVWVDALRNTEMILNWGCDGETTPWGGGGIEMNSQLMYWTTEAGIENVFVCPDLNYSANIHADKWIPVLPNTDTALLAALSYVWISEDTYDKDFVENDKYCVGFDKWKAYVMGDEDGVAKTPEWASSKCGVPEWTIKALARNWATHTTSEAMGNGGSFIRGPYCSEPARMMVYSLAMQGLGNPGVYQLSYIEVGASGLPGATSVATSTFSDFGGGPITNPRGGVGSMGATQAQFVVKPLYADSIWATHDNPISWYCKDHCTREEQFVKYTYPVSEDYPRFHMIWMSSCCITVCWQGGFKHTNALRDPSIEIIVGQHMTLENDLQFCDIILPEVRKLECDDLMSDSGGGHFSYIVKETKACEPVGEAKTNFQIVYGLAKKLEEYGGKYKNLANTFCAGYPDDEEAMRHAVDNMPDEYKAYCNPDYLWDNHFYTIPGNPNWEDRGFEGGFYKFRADPESNPLETQTGKIEFECQDIKEHMPDDEERPPVAHYIAGADGWTHNESKEGSRASDYPLLIVSNHPRWREHAQMNSNVWLREIKWCKMRGPDGYMYEPVWINPQDADSRGIKTGDLVKIFNDRGVVLSVAHVNERIIPGAVWQDHGAPIDIIREAAFEPDTKTVDPPDIPSGEFTQLGIDRSGSNNLISPLVGVSQNCTGGMATSGYLVQLERLSLDEMDQWKKTYPDVFDKDYDYDGGLRFEAYLADDEGGTD